MVILDTHALIWWTLSPSYLSKNAKKICDNIVNTNANISSISIWEIGIKLKNKKLDIGMSISEYLDKIKLMNIINIIPIDENIWIESLMLEWNNRDPADRVIVATAKRMKLPIITKDKRIREFYKKTIW